MLILRRKPLCFLIYERCVSPALHKIITAQLFSVGFVFVCKGLSLLPAFLIMAPRVSVTVALRFVFRKLSSQEINRFISLVNSREFTTFTLYPIKEWREILEDPLDKRVEAVVLVELRHNDPHLTKEKRHTLVAKMLVEITELTKRGHDSCLPTNGIISISILSRDIFPSRFKLNHMFKVGCMFLGSITEHSKITRAYYIQAPEADTKSLLSYIDSFLHENRSEKSLGHPMVGIFEHDRKQLSVDYPIVFYKFNREGKKIAEVKLVEFRIKYGSIARIFVTMHKNGRSNHISGSTHDNDVFFTMTLQLAYPMQLFMFFRQGENSRTKGKRIFHPAAIRYKTTYPDHERKNVYRQDQIDAIARCNSVSIECSTSDFRSFLDCFDRLQKAVDRPIEFRYFDRIQIRHFSTYKPNILAQLTNLLKEKVRQLEETGKPYYTHSIDGEELVESVPHLKPYAKLFKDEYFPLVYAIEGLISRGGAIYDYFFHEKYAQFNGFLDLCISCFETDLREEKDDGKSGPVVVTKTQAVLEEMLQQLDRRPDTPMPVVLFNELYNNPTFQLISEISADLYSKGYMRVRKIMITPTRSLWVNPELIMGNRSLRRVGADKMLRIIFRDDDGTSVSTLPNPLISSTVTKTMLEYMFVGLRQWSYVGSSNSQMRDHGCYFLQGTDPDAVSFRLSCGRFKIEAVSKMMSRLAQCFTQSRELSVTIDYSAYDETYDYLGGADSNGKSYTFSDGVGMVSREFCRTIAKDMELGDSLPCCFQIRFRGYKGVILMTPWIDETRAWANAVGIKRANSKKNEWYDCDILFRPSQSKFQGPRERNVEIVKISAPIPVSLNKPLINILDQVSEMQSPEVHKRMCNRISELLDHHINTVTVALTDEAVAFQTLSEFPRYIQYDRLNEFYITEEPFFRSMLRASAHVALDKLENKMQIRVPTTHGRMMFGVVDDTGLLQYGQVFFQYTSNHTIKWPTADANRIVHKGLVMITKNPSVVAGDVRMFEAVDLPCLHHLVDVLVFPQHGPRPHPDEMAGSDLDGDEYSIFWDTELFLDHSEEAFDFTGDPAPPADPKMDDDKQHLKMKGQMVNFFTNYVSQDSIGTIANAHLANSDLYGINSKQCHGIAKKHNKAVDFPKTGNVPDELTKEWKNEHTPPEMVERYPDFMLRPFKPNYRSRRLLGRLFTQVETLNERVRFESLVSCAERVVVDHTIVLPEFETFKGVAIREFDEYSTLVQSLCDNYGIRNEGELFSGRFVVLKKRISERDNDDMSLYNTGHMIEENLGAIYAKFRRRFFDEFGGLESCTKLDDSRQLAGVNIVFRRVCKDPSIDMRLKASAYYHVAYTKGCYLSFPWMVADILAVNRQQYLMQPGNQKFTICPLYDKLTQHINKMITSDEFSSEFSSFLLTIRQCSTGGGSSTEMSKIVSKYCPITGLPELLFFIRKWAAKHNVAITPKQLDVLFLLHGLGMLTGCNAAWLSAKDTEASLECNLTAQMGGIGKRFWDFIQFLMARKFSLIQELSLRPMSGSSLDHEQCNALSLAATDTFYPIAINRTYETLPGPVEQHQVVKSKITEGLQPFVIEIPIYVGEDYGAMLSDVSKKCGCSYVCYRRKPDLSANHTQVVVRPVGTIHAIRKLRDVLAVYPRMNTKTLKDRSNALAELVYRKLQFYSQENVDIDTPFPEDWSPYQY